MFEIVHRNFITTSLSPVFQTNILWKGPIDGGGLSPQKPPVCPKSSVFLPYYVVWLSATVVAPLRTTDGSTFLQQTFLARAWTPGAICKIQSTDNA